ASRSRRSAGTSGKRSARRVSALPREAPAASVSHRMLPTPFKARDLPHPRSRSTAPSASPAERTCSAASSSASMASAWRAPGLRPRARSSRGLLHLLGRAGRLLAVDARRVPHIQEETAIATHREVLGIAELEQLRGLVRHGVVLSVA